MIGSVAAAAAARVAAGVAATMENGRVYAHYDHTDACNCFRWTARESFQFMYGRPWEKVAQFYFHLVHSGKGAASLSSLFPNGTLDATASYQSSEEKTSLTSSPKHKGGRWERTTFKIVLSYHGGSFDGWQKQPCLNTVQGLVEKSLGQFVDERKLKQFKEKTLPVEGCAVVAGRTDKGVTALQQVCSFYTWRKDVKIGDIKDAINEAAPEKLTALDVLEVSREFHPNFAAKWRRYLYIFPLDELQTGTLGRDYPENVNGLDSEVSKGQPELEEEELPLVSPDGNEDHIGIKPKNFSVSKVDRLIKQLEGKLLSYKMFARDTQASRSIGPATDCFMFHSRATVTNLPFANKGCGVLRVMCVELVANRFLRKMVRVLVATAVREAAAGAADDALLKLMDATCRRATAPPAPPEGLCLVDVGYGEFNHEHCFITD